MSRPSEMDLRALPDSPFNQVVKRIVDRIGGTDWEIHFVRRRPLRFHPRRRSAATEVD